MAKLLTFTNDHFAHLSPAAKLEVKRVVYRKDFQEAVLSLRQMHNIRKFPKLDIEKIRKEEADFPFIQSHRYRRVPVADREHVPEFYKLLEYKPLPTKLWPDVCATVDRLTGGRDTLLWQQLLYVFTRFNFIPIIVTDEEALTYPPSHSVLGSLERRYKREDKMIREGKMPKDRERSFGYVFYQSDTIVARLYDRDVVLRFTPDAPSKKLREVLKAIEVYQRHFKRRRLGGRDAEQLDMYNDIAEWHRQGWNENKIQQKLEEDYRRYDIASIGQLVMRAMKELGF